MNSDEYYSSDSYSDKKINIPVYPTKQFRVPLKTLVQKTSASVNSKPIINKRPIPGLSKARNSTKLPQKQVPIRGILKPSIIKRNILIPFDSESSSYYDYEYESESEDLPNIQENSNTTQLNTKVTNQSNIMIPNQINKQSLEHQNDNVIESSSPSQQAAYPIIIQYEDDELNQDDQNSKQLNESSSSEWCDVFEYRPEYEDTNEEPEIKINKQTLNQMRIIQNGSQQRIVDENVDSSNISNESPNSKVCQREKLVFKVICTKSQITNYAFQFFNNDQCLMTAFSSNIRKSITFSVPELSKQEDINIGTMSISKNKRQFNLLCYGKEVMSAEVSTIKKPFLYDGYFTINLKYPDTNNKDIVLNTMLPSQKQGKKYSKKSIKRVILADSNDQILIIVKKIREHQFEIEASSLINDDLNIFAIGVATWTFFQ